jgi:hypothetical protein
VADLDSIANEAIKQLTTLKSHLAAGDKSRGTMANVARKDWAGKYRDEFETGLKGISSQSSSVQGDIDGLIGKIKRELAAAKKDKGGN